VVEIMSPPLEIQVLGRRVVQPDPALGDQLQDHGGDEGLGVAADPDMPVRRRLGGLAQPAHPGRADPLAALVVDPQLYPCETGVDDLLDGLLQLRPIGKGDGHGVCSFVCSGVPAETSRPPLTPA
jgi:hypothetical protein